MPGQVLGLLAVLRDVWEGEIRGEAKLAARQAGEGLEHQGSGGPGSPGWHGRCTWPG